MRRALPFDPVWAEARREDNGAMDSHHDAAGTRTRRGRPARIALIVMGIVVALIAALILVADAVLPGIIRTRAIASVRSNRMVS